MYGFFIAGSWERPRQFCHPLSKKRKRVYDRQVIIDTFHGEVSLLEQDTIENVS